MSEFEIAGNSVFEHWRFDILTKELFLDTSLVYYISY